MEGLEIIEDKNEELLTRVEDNTDFNYLKLLNETKQAFLKVNNFDVSVEPDYRDYTEDDFIMHIENSKNTMIINKLEEFGIEDDFRSSMSHIYESKDKKRRIFVLFLPNNKGNVGIDIVKNFIRLVRVLDCKNGLLISQQSLTPKSIEIIESTNVQSDYQDDIYNIKWINGAFISSFY